MADRRISKIKSVWGNGLAGKIIVVVVAGATNEGVIEIYYLEE